MIHMVRFLPTNHLTCGVVVLLANTKSIQGNWNFKDTLLQKMSGYKMFKRHDNKEQLFSSSHFEEGVSHCW